MIPLEGQGGGLIGPSQHFTCRSVFRVRICFYTLRLPVLLQQSYCIAKPWPPIPPRPASPFPLLSGQPRFYLVHLPQPAGCSMLKIAACCSTVPLCCRRHCCAAGSGQRQQCQPRHQTWGRCTECVWSAAHKTMAIMMLRISCDVDAVKRVEHSSHPVFERSTTMGQP